MLAVCASLRHLTVACSFALGCFSHEAAAMFFATKAILLKGYFNYFLAHFTCKNQCPGFCNPKRWLLCVLWTCSETGLFISYHHYGFIERCFAAAAGVCLPARCVCAK